MTTFETFNLDPAVLDSLRENGYLEPTPVQQKTIPPILEGRDLIALAETGSGKTAACAIPICHKVDTSSRAVQALVVVPTRELALQYSTEAQKIGKVKGVKAFALFGGEDMDLQLAKLKDGVHVLIATPGRLIDLIYARHIDLTQVNTLILDEADQMLGMGFIEDLEFIIQCLIHEHQTLLFSATMPPGIPKIAKHHMKDPLEISLISKRATPKNLSHKFVFSPNPREKGSQLITLLKELKPSQCLIFANSRLEVERLHRELKRHFPATDFLHGGLAQSTRTVITSKFLKGKIRALIATDVASRGLDFSGVTHVINVHFPREQETYLHRAGRTGRQGREGLCVTLISKRELSQLGRLMDHLKQKPQWIGKGPPSRPPQR